MKHSCTRMMLFFAALATMASCSKDNVNENGGVSVNTVNGFNYPIAQLYGTWDCTHILNNNEWQEVSNMFSATFYDDGSYYGRGVLGDGAGTYVAQGNTITTYIEGREFYKYYVIKFSGTTAELKMYYGTTQAEIENSTRVIRVQKRIELAGTKWACTLNLTPSLHRSDVIEFKDKTRGKYIISVTGLRSGITDDEGNTLYPGDNQPYYDEVEYSCAYSFMDNEGNIEYTDEDGIFQNRQFSIMGDTLWLSYGTMTGANGRIPMNRF